MNCTNRFAKKKFCKFWKLLLQYFNSYHYFSFLFLQTDSSLLTEIWEKIQTSYKISVQEISEVIKLKVDFVKTLNI